MKKCAGLWEFHYSVSGCEAAPHVNIVRLSGGLLLTGLMLFIEAKHKAMSLGDACFREKLNINTAVSGS